MSYAEFLDNKLFNDVQSGFDVEISGLNERLFDFQKVIVKWALARGRAAVFADTGLGKTAMQCEWAKHVADHTGGRVLIVAPLCVAKQTVKEAAKFGIKVEYRRDDAPCDSQIIITNYEMVDEFYASSFEGVVLDESAILKHQASKTRKKIIDKFKRIKYKLSCTATPSPNDFMELGSQSEFIGVMSAVEMLAMFFTHDGGETSKWRLKGHGQVKFWEWLSTWAVCIRKPSDLGFDDSAYDLPGLNVIEHMVETGNRLDGELFAKPAESLIERRRAQRISLEKRCAVAAEIVNNSDEIFLVWCHLNDESALLKKLINGAVDIKGSDSIDEKELRIDGFSSGDTRVLVSKASITGHGMNWQHCANMIFVGLSDSFEQYYQAVRRCYRFGQEREVNVHLVVADIEGNIRKNLERKQIQHDQMSENMVSHMRVLMSKKVVGTKIERANYMREKSEGRGWDLHLGDCIDVAKEIDEGEIDYTIYSPPFSSLYTYSNSERDMGNCTGDGEFYKHFNYLADELFRVTRPGRLMSFHCMNLPTSKQNHGFIGIRDFRGEMIRLFLDKGFIYHSEVVIWKDPVIAMQRTKALGLLHKQIKKDSTMSRQGIPDYLVTMRKPGENDKPVTHTNESFPVNVWQRYASPIWMDINPSNTLQFRTARENDDERHICPLQLEVIERAINLWTNPDDLVFSPFTGIGSEGYTALQMGRRFIGAELKKSYYDLAVKNLKDAKASQGSLFEVA